MPWEYRPYRVRVLVAFGSDPLLAPAYRRHVLDRIGSLAARTFGLRWQLEVGEDHQLLPPSTLGLERLSPEALRERHPEGDIDKVYFLTVETAGHRYILNGREWETRLRDLGATETAESYLRREVPELAVSLLAQLFRPLLSVHDADLEADTVQLRTQAGGFPPGDPEAVGIRSGDVIVPVFRYMNRKKVVRRVQSLPLTFLLVRSVDGPRVSTSLVSSFRVPIGASRRRVEQLAVLARIRAEGTRLRLVPRSNPNQPLVAHNVAVHAKTQPEDEPQGEPRRVITDRWGRAYIPADPEQPIVWIEVRSGRLLLARIPFVPGLVPEDTTQVPDDSLRLSAEGEVALLQGRMIETIAKRSAHMSRARALASNGDHDAAAEQMAALEELPGIDEFKTQLTAIRVPALKAAEAQGNARAASMIKKLCDRAAEQIETFLDQDKVRALREELEEIRKLDAADRAALSEN